MEVRIGCANNENEAFLALFRRAEKLALGGREAGVVLGAVLSAEDAEVDGAGIDLGQVDLIRAAVGSGQILEQEDVEVTPEQRVTVNEFLQRAPFGCEFLLYAAD